MAIKNLEDGTSMLSATISMDTTVGDMIENVAAGLETLSRIVPVAFEKRIPEGTRVGNVSYSCAIALCECLSSEIHTMAVRLCMVSDVLEDEVSGMAGMSDERVALLYALHKEVDEAARAAARREGAGEDD